MLIACYLIRKQPLYRQLYSLQASERAFIRPPKSIQTTVQQGRRIALHIISHHLVLVCIIMVTRLCRKKTPYESAKSADAQMSRYAVASGVKGYVQRIKSSKKSRQASRYMTLDRML
ncbi:hypothetical protein BDW02DRAFT_83433 [Decorospora gaudefroyi]|uniref:Uncharacterized protein n=1 Tax=Decorospora gaudefroyi TaxID=184978 RepID=A0A6A5KPG3_9PLEO|nr:hypothetical protein BDW02DRAFT_83433 [Decorospora gaudefroyi]